MKKLKHILAMTAITFVPATLLAQNDETSYSESVMVVSEYKPTLEESFKLNVAPQIVDTAETIQHNFSYSIVPTRLTSVFQPTRIKAAKIIGEPTSRLYNNYLRLGFGSSWGPLLDAYYNSTRSKIFCYGARLFHESQLGRIGRQDPDNFLNPDYYGRVTEGLTSMSIFGKYILKDKVQFSSDLGYENDRNLYYGFSDSVLNTQHPGTGNYRDSISRSDYRISYNRVAWNLGARSLNTDVNQFGYTAKMNLSDLWATYGQNEFNVGLDGTVHYGFPLLKQSKGIVALQVVWQHYANNFMPDSIAPGEYQMPFGYSPITPATAVATAPKDSAKRNTFIAHPYLDFIFRGLNIHAGASFGMDGYSEPDSAASFKFYPDIVVSKSFMKEAMNISLGATGGLDANTLDFIRQVNPYIMPGAPLMATKHYDFYAHMRLDFSKKLRLLAHADYSMRRDDLNFQLDYEYALRNVYVPIYQDINILRVGADFAFLNDEMLTLELGGNYYLYDGVRNPEISALFPNYDDQSFHAYRPNFDAHLTADLNYKDKVLVHLQGLLLGRMPGEYVFDNSENSVALDTLGMRAGVNVEVEYLHNRALSFFVKFDNILAQRYFYWTNYPGRRFTALAGLTYTIPTKRR